MYGEAERRTLLNLIQAIDKNQVLLSTDKSAPVKRVRCELWMQVTDSFNDITGKNASVKRLHQTLKRIRLNVVKAGKYLEYDKDEEKWTFL